MHKDKDYVVLDGEVLIIDPHTGRALPGRRFNDGLHQAIEAKEGVEVKKNRARLRQLQFKTISGCIRDSLV